jgi:hypothetical protein
MMRARRPVLRKQGAHGGYIAGPLYDWFFFISAPFIALGIGYALSAAGAYQHLVVARDRAGNLQQIALPALASAAFTHAHLVIVFFRSHLDRQIFKLHPYRFTVVPATLLVGSIASQWVFVIASVLTVWWDVYHSSLQTFGLARIYDKRAGNDPQLGRRADYLFNLVIYAGPVLAGVNLWAHLRSFRKFERVDAYALSSFADAIFARSGELRAAIIVAGLACTAGYLIHYHRLSRRGYRISPQKLALHGGTAFVSIACWGFGSFGEAFLIMNFFHAFQYFAIVWWSEKRTIMRVFHCPWQAALAILLCSGLGYGYWRARSPQSFVPIIALGNVVSLMHFWYDGFVWSVRKNQV